MVDGPRPNQWVSREFSPIVSLNMASCFLAVTEGELDTRVKANIFFLDTCEAEDYLDEELRRFVVVDLFAILAPSAIEMEESEIVLSNPEAPEENAVRLVNEALSISIIVSSMTNLEWRPFERTSRECRPERSRSRASSHRFRRSSLFQRR